MLVHEGPAFQPLDFLVLLFERLVTFRHLPVQFFDLFLFLLETAQAAIELALGSVQTAVQTGELLLRGLEYLLRFMER